MRQGIYDIMDREFESFVINNMKLLEDMKYGEVVDLRTLDKTRLCRQDMLEPPFNVSYLSKLDGGEGPTYVFLDRGLNKLYEYYDVK